MLALVVATRQTSAAKGALETAGAWDSTRRPTAAGGTIALPVRADAAAAAERVAAELDPPGAVAERDDLPLRRAAPAPGTAAAVRAALVALCFGSSEPDDGAAVAADLPAGWERFGDLVLLPETALVGGAAVWGAQYGSEAFWAAVAGALRAERLGRKARIADDGMRQSQVALLRGDDGWVKTRQDGVVYTLDVTKCMFSAGNVTERQRAGAWDCSGQTCVDLYCGIGYFTLPMLVHAGAAFVYACEWNPNAVEALRRNLDENGVNPARYEIRAGDNRVHAPRRVAHRILLGLLPSSRDGWPVAAAAAVTPTSPDDRVLMHVHENVHEAEIAAWTAGMAAEMRDLLAKEHGVAWAVEVVHVERVKSYAPRVYHIVVDLACKLA